jgi:hypothetical protein
MRHAVLAATAVLPLLVPPASAHAQTLLAEEIFDAAIGDWNRDGRPDLAILAQSNSDDGDSSLFIYLREDAEDGVLSLAFSAEDMFWGSGGSRRFYGQEPSLKALENGSLAITEQNFSVGRNRWTSTITVAWRGKQFVVAGYTFNSFDTLQEEEPLQCDLNLLTGRGFVNERAVSFPGSTVALADWQDGNGENPGLRICRDRS